MAAQSFTKNHRDHSNDTGFQFEFFCDKCGNGHRSAFKTNGLGVAASLLKAAGAMFGGRVNQAGWGVDHVKDAFRGPAWDSAFASAIEECTPRFRQCSLCGNWVCPEVCWNHSGTYARLVHRISASTPRVHRQKSPSNKHGSRHATRTSYAA